MDEHVWESKAAEWRGAHFRSVKSHPVEEAAPHTPLHLQVEEEGGEVAPHWSVQAEQRNRWAAWVAAVLRTAAGAEEGVRHSSLVEVVAHNSAEEGVHHSCPAEGVVHRTAVAVERHMAEAEVDL